MHRGSGPGGRRRLQRDLSGGGLGMDTLLLTYASWSTLVIRVTLGVIFFAHGAQKVLGWFGGYGLKGTTQYLTSVGIPLPVAYLVCFFELFGGVGLVFGLFTRLAALAIAIVHWQHGFFLNWSLTPGKGHGYEANLALLAMAVACLIAGGGAWSLDRLLLGSLAP
jgi:putative oxidoreductase